MTWTLHILRNGALERTLELEPGEHSVGRGQGCRVVLADQGVSGRHALFIVDAQSMLVRDLGSRNGVLHASDRISEMRFKAAFELDIGPYTLRATPEPIAKTSENKTKPALQVRLVVYAVSIGLAALVSLLGYLPTRDHFTAFRDREVLKRGILLGRYLAEINAQPLYDREFDRTRTLPVSQEEGVVFAYIVDTGGKILAPAADLGKSLDKAPYSAGLKEKMLKVLDGEMNTKIIFCPIKSGDAFLGGAVLGYDVERGAATLADHGPEKWFLSLVLSLGCGFLAGFALLRFMLRPLSRLAEEIGVCLKERRDSLDFPAASNEFKVLVEACNRLLRLATRPGLPQVTPDAPAQPAGPAAAVSPGTALDDLNLVWCRLDPESHRVLDHNAGFSALPGMPDQPRGRHLLEVFADPDLLQAVSALLEAPEIDAEIQSSGQRSFIVRKQAENSHLVLSFVEAAHG